MHALIIILIILFSFDIGIYLFGILISTNRIGLLILIITFSIKIVKNGNIPYSYFVNALFPFLFFTLYLSSTILTSKYSVTTLFSWFMITLVTFLISFIFDKVHFKVIERSILNISFPVLIILVILSIHVFIDLGISAFFGIPIRIWFDENIPGGLSRFMNALFVLSTLPFILLLSRNYYNKIRSYQSISIVTLFIFTLSFAFISGSRQTILAFLVSFIIYMILYNRKYLMKVLSVVFIIFLAIMPFVSVSSSNTIYENEMSSWVYDRFIEKTESDLSEGSTRKNIYLKSVSLINESPALGFGPGSPIKLLNNYPHNGYLGLFLEIGLLLSLPILLILYSFLIIKYISASNHIKNKGLLMTVTSTFIAFALVSVNFNDLLRDYLFWYLFALYASILANNKRF